MQKRSPHTSIKLVAGLLFWVVFMATIAASTVVLLHLEKLLPWKIPFAGWQETVNVILSPPLALWVANFVRSLVPGYRRPHQKKWEWLCRTSAPCQPEVQSSILLAARKASSFRKLLTPLFIMSCGYWSFVVWPHSHWQSLWGVLFGVLAGYWYWRSVIYYGNQDTIADDRGIVLSPKRIVPWNSIVKAQFKAEIGALNTIENVWVTLYDTQDKRIDTYYFPKWHQRKLHQLIDILQQTLGPENTFPECWPGLTVRANHSPNHPLQSNTPFSSIADPRKF